MSIYKSLHPLCRRSQLSLSLFSPFSSCRLFHLSCSPDHKPRPAVAQVQARSPPALPTIPRTTTTTHRQAPRSFATMSVAGHSAACCTIPPVVVEGYQTKGTYEAVGGKKTYVVGPDDATKALIFVFDIFGFRDQSLQGADIVAFSNSHNKYKIFMPDWFDGEPAPLGIVPPDTDEKLKTLMSFLTKNSPPTTAAALPAYVEAVKAQYPQLTTFGVVGFCWGGKVVSLVTSGDANPFAAGIEVHPAMVDPEDAKKIKVPLAMLASMDENADDVAKFEQSLTVPHHVETFADQVHGWMAARADFQDARKKEEYVRGYQIVVDFFSKHL